MKNNIFITHYYLKGTKPFQSLTRIPFEEAIKVADELKNRSEKIFRRFNNAEMYLKERITTEKWLKEEFIKQGGCPQCDNHFYFVLGNSSHLEEAFDDKYSKVQLLLESVNENEISFTYSDSMASRFLTFEKDAPYYNADYHGRVFTKEKILKVIEQYGLTGERWRNDRTRKYDYYIEAQVWNEKIIHELVNEKY